MVLVDDDLQSGRTVWTSSEHTFDRRVTPRFIGGRSFFFPFMQYLVRRNINLGAASLVRDIDATRRACRICIFCIDCQTHRHANVFDHETCS